MAPKLLVVDDSEDILILLSTLLRQSGFDVVLAAHGEQAFDILQKDQSFDAVVSDILMPKGDGTWLLSQMKKNQMDIPVVFITAGSDFSRDRAIEQGAADLVKKPLDIDALEDLIRRVVK